MSFNILNLLPPQYRSEILTSLISTISLADDTSSVVLSIREILDKIAYLEHLLDPYRVPNDYLQYLADLIGATLASDSVASEPVRRKELLRMIDWYKVKGTYQSIDIISLITGLTIEVYDKYTNDYINFSDQDWFIGDEDENPTGLASTYYKSPHFGVSFLLDKAYPVGSEYDEGSLPRHLWRPSLFTGLSEYIEKTRPVNTVPHYQILSRHATYEDGEVSVIENSEVVTQIVGSWEYSKLFFDGAGSFEEFFDTNDSDGSPTNFFDSSFEALISSVNQWKLGTGGKDLLDSEVVYEVSPVVFSGTITSTTIYNDRIEFKFSVPTTTILNGINELGLYRSGTGELVIMSTFPAIYKGNRTRLDFTVIIYRD